MPKIPIQFIGKRDLKPDYKKAFDICAVFLHLYYLFGLMENLAALRDKVIISKQFSLHKLWLSRQNDREPIKRKRDRAQARAVYRLVQLYLPNLKFDPSELRMFPKAIVTEVKNEIESSDLPPGYV